MKLSECIKCAHHLKKTRKGIRCSYYHDQILTRTLLDDEDIDVAFVLDCPVNKIVILH